MAALTRLGPLGIAGGLALGLVTLAVAAPGDLDPAFGTGGRAVVSPAVESVASAVALQPDGKVVLAGWADDLAPPPPPPPAPDAPVRNSDFLVARLVVRGNLDPTFGSDGSVRTPIDLAGGGTDAAWAVAVGPAGEIYVGGTAHKSGGSDVAIVRYTQGGTLDTGFNGTGIRTVDVHAIDDLYGLAVQPDGKVVAVARGGPGFTVVRIHSSGALDGAFGSGGVVETQVANPGVQDQATAVVLPETGRSSSPVRPTTRSLTPRPISRSSATCPTAASTQRSEKTESSSRRVEARRCPMGSPWPQAPSSLLRASSTGCSVWPATCRTVRSTGPLAAGS